MVTTDDSGNPPASIAPETPSETAESALDVGDTELAELARAAQQYASESRAAGTRATYAKHWSAFVAWCSSRGLDAMPAAPKTVALYLAARAKQQRRPSTLGVTLSAIAAEHELAGHGSPLTDRLVQETWSGIRRRLGTAPKKKEPLTTRELRSMMDVLPAGLIAQRDRALLLLGFAGGFRRSELVAIDVSELKFVREGLEAFVASSKTDQERKGHTKVLAYGSDPATCPVRALKDWLELTGLLEGPVFRPINRHEQLGQKRLTDHAVAVIVKRTAAKAGLSVPELSGHSLRAGFVTEAAKNGADYPAIMDQTGHESLNTVHGYNRRKKKWEKPASAKLGL